MKEQVHGGDVYRHPDVIDFSSNMNPLGTPESVIKAVCDSMQRISQYPDVRCEELIKALAEYDGCDEDMFTCGNGAAELIFSLAQAYRPKKALLQAPTFAEYAQALECVGCDIEYFDTTEDGFYISDRYIDALDESYDIAFLCNPNNPTGFVIDPDRLKKIVCVCREKQILLVVDECFQDFVSEEKTFSLKECLKGNDYLFLLKAFTKRYAMAGLRLGYGITDNKKLIENMETIVQPWNVSLPAQAAGCAALKETTFVSKGREIVQNELPWLKEQMKNLGLQVFDSQANYIFFKGPADLKEACLEEHILIRSCSNYPALSEGYFRVAVKTHADNERLITVLKKICTF